MQKIYAQRNLLFFLIFLALLFTVAGILGAIFTNLKYLFMLIGSCLFLALIPLLLYNKIYYNEEKIKFHFLIRKLELKWDDVKEISLKKDFLLGYDVIFNFSEATNEEFNSFYEYGEFCIEYQYDTLYVTCVNKKDIAKLLENYKGKIVNIKNLF